ncbi:MAG TPA: DEAD/DEAH box helicase [Bacteroidales bacterium]|nr:MAG: ATP-dependent RNA helicase RhlE [Bacteroidetes bacterium ADurb.Bin217]HPM12455.1 DEAD/DEAH box helicase [Bacteroidales bacterium]
MKFQEYTLCKEIKQNLQELGYIKPTDIQYKAIPSILKGEDVLAIAQTGTGKTAAFVIPILEILYNRTRQKRHKQIQCVIMEPTRELVIQTARVCNQLAKQTSITTLGLLGGVEQDPQIAVLEKGVDILVATPGRLFDLISQGYVSLQNLKILAVDEADHMLDLGFINDIRQLLRHIPRYRQTLFFSATISPEIKDLAYSLVHKPVRIQISPKDPVSKNIDHFVSYIEMDDKRFFLEQFITSHSTNKILVFVRTKVRAERVKSAMERVGIATETIHGDKIQKERNQIMKQFSDGTIHVLIATDISARGVDIPNIDFVINYDLPDEVENYVHRIGRTGRGTQRGTSISFCSSSEKEMLQNIETFISKPISVLEIDKSTYKQTILESSEFRLPIKELLQEIDEIEIRKKKKKKK